MSITPNRTITFTNPLSGEFYSFTAYGGFNINKKLNDFSLNAVNTVKKYDLTDVVQVVINKKVFNDKLGIYNATAKEFENDSITISNTDFVRDVSSIGQILSVGKLSTVYKDFSDYVNSYFSTSGFPSILSSETYSYNDYIFDASALIHIIKPEDNPGGVSGSITINDVNQILKYSLENNIFGNRPKIDTTTLFNNGSISHGFRAGDLILISPPQKNSMSLTEMKNSYSTGIVVNLDLSLNPGSIIINGGGSRYPKSDSTADTNTKSTANSNTTYTNSYFVATIDEIKFSRFATIVFILSD